MKHIESTASSVQIYQTNPRTINNNGCEVEKVEEVMKPVVLTLPSRITAG